MPNNVIWPRPQFQNSSGAPLANGTLTTYAAGTTTLKATYPSAANLNSLTGPNSNPMTLNSNGSIANDLWLYGSYKFIIADSSGAIVYTSDNINDPDSIRDSNGNIILKLTPVASAVNQIQISNAATGQAPSMIFTGSDTNVSGTINCTGTGALTISPATTITGALTVTGGLSIGAGTAALTLPAPSVTIPGNAGNSASIILGENTNNGSNTMTIAAPSSFASNITWTLPSVTTSGLWYNTSGTLSNLNGYIIKQFQTNVVLSGASAVTGITYGTNTGTSVGTVSITPSSSSSYIMIWGEAVIKNTFAGVNNGVLNIVGGTAGTTWVGGAYIQADVSSASDRAVTIFGWYQAGGTSAQTITFKLGPTSANAGFTCDGGYVIVLEILPV